MAATRTTPASEAWRSLLVAFTTLRDEFAHELLEKEGIHLEHYEILLMLYEAGDEGIRPSDLAERRRVTRSGATRLTDRLESKGIVERRPCGDDRRGNVIVLAKEGKRIFTRAGRLHLAGIERLVGQRLTLAELATLQTLLDKLVEP